ncbi:hypothetical protein CCACVL1_16636 [Corchorus capsularis]|uniref:Uncharacterized protein n=1 Tax=Corchorus capsularis TaxID=210143 RepID=A0A1R3HVZ7_COCAP|nr:hypothetical protein CCACVL1_16636 [Corchorus capsularis]
MMTTKTSFWLERTLLIGLLYLAVEGDKNHFFPMLAALILHDFILFIVKDVVYSSFKAQSSDSEKRWKLKSINPMDINSIIKSGHEKVNYNYLKEDYIDEYEGDPELGRKENHEEKCKMVVKQEAMKAKGKYKEKYKKKLMEKEEKFKKDKSCLKDQHDEDRDKWEQERKLLKKKYEEMRWT